MLTGRAGTSSSKEDQDVTALSPPPAPPDAPRLRTAAPRRIQRRAALPGGRAVVGALLMVLAAVGVFVAYTDATDAPSTSYVVAAHDLRPGDAVEAADLEVVAVDLPRSVAEHAFTAPADLHGRILLAPIAAGEVVQRSAVSSEVPAEPGTEVALALPREQIAAGRLRAGDRVDVFVTTDERTVSVARGVLVVELEAGDDDDLARADVEVVVMVPDADVVAAIVHALRRGDVTVVRSTFSEPSDEVVAFDAAAPGDSDQADPRR